MYQPRTQTKSAVAIFVTAAVFIFIVAGIVVGLFASGVIPQRSHQDVDDVSRIERNMAEAEYEIPNLPGNGTDLNSTANATGFDIELRFVVPTSPEISQVFLDAKSRWESIITNDFETLITIQEGERICGFPAPASEIIDDLLIYVNVGTIDGVGNVLANAGPCGTDSQGRIRVGTMNFDIADFQNLLETNRAGVVVLHEMGHVLGFGTLWESKDLIDEHGWFFKSYTYKGEQGNIGNEEVGLTGEAIIEDTGGQGTAMSHWKETVYTIELMTGFVSPSGPAPLSLLTVRSLVDLGYTVDTTKADPFQVTTSLRGAETEESSDQEAKLSYGEDILKLPMTTLSEQPKPGK